MDFLSCAILNAPQHLVYVIDTAAVDSRDPYEDFLTLRKELEHYSPQILQKPFIVALNKVDCEEAKQHLEAFKEKYPFDQDTLFEISAKEATGIPPLIEKMRNFAQETAKDSYEKLITRQLENQPLSGRFS